MEPIRIFNRETQALETEKVYGEKFLRWAYGNPLGKISLHALVKQPAFSKWYGGRMSTPDSAERVKPFIKDYGLDAEEFESPPEAFSSFNEFFYRKLKAGARPIEPSPESVVFPADGRHFAFEDVSAISSFFVKGQRFDLPALLDDKVLADRYAKGSLVLSRLCPVDYHRFHFPCAGTPGETRLINGPLFSVSPIALRKQLCYLWQNKRTLTQLETSQFGTVLLLEIGATCVGSIHQTYRPGVPVDKGAEKGYFAFGGSSTITIFEPQRIHFDHDLLQQSARQIELYAKIGDRMGLRRA